MHKLLFLKRESEKKKPCMNVILYDWQQMWLNLLEGVCEAYGDPAT